MSMGLKSRPPPMGLQATLPCRLRDRHVQGSRNSWRSPCSSLRSIRACSADQVRMRPSEGCRTVVAPEALAHACVEADRPQIEAIPHLAKPLKAAELEQGRKACTTSRRDQPSISIARCTRSPPILTTHWPKSAYGCCFESGSRAPSPAVSDPPPQEPPQALGPVHGP